jgi:hypothetical protein
MRTVSRNEQTENKRISGISFASGAKGRWFESTRAYQIFHRLTSPPTTKSRCTRDKLSAARKKGKWVGGHPVLGYDIDSRGGRLVVNPDEADRVRAVFDLYLEHEGLVAVLQELDTREWHNKGWTTGDGNIRIGKRFTKASFHGLLTNVI